LSDFPYLEEQGIREALAYAASLAQKREPGQLMRIVIDMNLTPPVGSVLQGRGLRISSLGDDLPC